MIRVNEVVIDADAIAQEAQYHPAESKEAALGLAANALIIEKLLLQRAIELGISVEREEKEDYIDEVLNADVAFPKASEEECKRYFEENRSKFTTTPYVETSHILLGAAPDDLNTRAQLINKAKSWIKDLNEGKADFAQLAQQFSDCPSKESDGFLGVLERGSTVTEFEKKVFIATPGILAHPIETRYGVHIINVHKNTKGKQLEFDAVKSQVSAFLDDSVQRQAIAQYIEKLTREASIEGLENVASSEH